MPGVRCLGSAGALAVPCLGSVCLVLPSHSVATTTQPPSAAGGGCAAAVVVATLWQGKTRQTEPRQGTASEPAEPRQSTPGKLAAPSQATLRVATIWDAHVILTFDYKRNSRLQE